MTCAPPLPLSACLGPLCHPGELQVARPRYTSGRDGTPRPGRAHRATGGASASSAGPSRSATNAARLNFMASLRGMPVTNSTVLGTL